MRLWDVESGRELKELGHPEFVLSVVFTPDGRHAVTAGGRHGPEVPEAGEDFAIRLWELPAEQGR